MKTGRGCASELQTADGHLLPDASLDGERTVEVGQQSVLRLLAPMPFTLILPMGTIEIILHHVLSLLLALPFTPLEESVAVSTIDLLDMREEDC